jgi:cysteine-rich repeat protein
MRSLATTSLALLFALVAPATAAPVVDQSQDGGDFPLFLNDAGTWQTFTAGVSAQLLSVDLRVSQLCMMPPPCVVGDLTVEIVTTSGGAPTQTVLGNATVPDASIPDSGTATAISVDLSGEGIDLVGGTTFAIRVAAPAATGFTQVFAAPGDPYPDGGAFQDTDGEGDFDPVVVPFDLRFQTVMDVPVCGDSLEELGEECDDGNTIAGDGCSASCTDEFCGDGTVSLTDLCDDGNTADGDGCSSTCDLETPGHACQDAIGKAGAKYLSARVKALQRCRTALLSGKPVPVDHPAECADSPTTELAMYKTAGAARKAIAARCDDALIAALGLCAETLDDYLSPSANAGCFRTEHDAAADALLRAEYGY